MKLLKLIDVALFLMVSTLWVKVHAVLINITHITECDRGSQYHNNTDLMIINIKNITNIQNQSTVQVEWKKDGDNEFKFKERIYLNRSSKTYSVNHCSNGDVEVQYPYHSDEEYSGEVFRAKIVFSNSTEIKSETVDFPEVYSKPVTRKLVINGKEIKFNDTNCEIVIDSCEKNFLSTACDLNIMFICESQLYPCFIELKLNESSKVVAKTYSNYHLYYTKSDTFNVFIAYYLCKISYGYKKIQCEIKTEVNTTFPQTESCACVLNDHWKVACIVLIVFQILTFLVGLPLVVFGCVKYRRQQETPQGSREEYQGIPTSGEPPEEETLT